MHLLSRNSIRHDDPIRFGVLHLLTASLSMDPIPSIPPLPSYDKTRSIHHVSTGPLCPRKPFPATYIFSCPTITSLIGAYPGEARTKARRDAGSLPADSLGLLVTYASGTMIEPGLFSRGLVGENIIHVPPPG